MAPRSQRSLRIPQEIMEEILSRVPVEALLKFRYVSKSWQRLIDSEQFIKAHFENSRRNTGFLKHRVILYYNCLLQQCHLQSLLNGASFDPVKNPMLDYVSVVGSFNGLVCLVERNRYFIMWNPSTRISHRLPEIDSVTNGTKLVFHCGMGWFESSGEYKIFAVIGVRVFAGDKEYLVYSSKTNSWKTVMHEYSNLKFEKKVGQFLSGKLHWVMDYAPNNVVSFDMKSEVLGMIELPYKPDLMCCWLLGVLGGKLCSLLINQSFWRKGVDVWVMKEYGVKESWQKLEPPFPASAPFFERENGEVVVFFGNAFLVYYPKENVFEYMDGLPFPGEVLLCMETLVSPLLQL